MRRGWRRWPERLSSSLVLRAELAHGSFVLLRRGCGAVEVRVVLHKRDALPLYCVEDDARGLVSDVSSPEQSLLDSSDVVPVDARTDGPAKGAILLVQGI